MQDMLRANPVSLNAISYDAVIRALEIIRSGRAPSSSSKTPAEELVKNKSGTKTEIQRMRDSSEAPIVTDVFIDTVGDPAYYKSRLVQALGKKYNISSFVYSIIYFHTFMHSYIYSLIYSCFYHIS